MNADLLTGEARAFYEQFSAGNKPIVDVDAEHQRAVFTWHFVPRPWPAPVIDQIWDRRASMKAIEGCETRAI